MFLLIWIRSEVQKAWLTGAFVLRREWMGMDGNGWEWMGMDGLLGLLIVSRWIIPENSLRLAQVSPSSHYSGVPQKESRNSTKFKWHKTRKLPQTSGDFELQWSVAGG